MLRLNTGLRSALPVYRSFRALHTSRPLAAIKPYLLADIGEGIKECEVIQWFVEPGAKIEEFDPICEVQSDKASVEITSRYDGIVKKLHYEPGQMAHVGKPLVDIDIPEEQIEEGGPIGGNAAQVDPEPQSAQQARPESTLEQQPNTKSFHETLATPAVRRVCRELNIDISQVSGTGKQGRVLKEDVINHSKGATAATSAPSASSPAENSTPDSSSKLEETVTQLTPIQKQMFKTMTKSLSIPHFLYTDEVEMDKLVSMRSTINQELANSKHDNDITKMSFMPFFIKALSLALNKYPLLNSRVSFVENDKPVLITRPQHNIGIAMDTPMGLIVPNIKNVESKTLVEIAKELTRLQQLGQQGKLTTTDLKGGTITLSNIGTVGGTYVAPVIVDSEVAIVGLGQSKKLPRYDENMNVIPTTIMNTSWSGDHRVVDGMSMARMVDLWKSYVQDPEKMLMHTK